MSKNRACFEYGSGSGCDENCPVLLNYDCEIYSSVDDYFKKERDEMPNKTAREKIDFIQDCDERHRCNNLTDWERDFIDSIDIQTSNGKDTSWKQNKMLNKIYAKVEEAVG